MPEYRFHVTEVRRYVVRVEAWSEQRAEEDARYYGFWHDSDGAIGKSVEIEHEEPAEVEVVPVSDLSSEHDHWVPPGPLPQFMQDLAEELRPASPQHDDPFWSDYGPRSAHPGLPTVWWARCKHCNDICQRERRDPTRWRHMSGLRQCRAPHTTEAEPADDDSFNAFDFD